MLRRLLIAILALVAAPLAAASVADLAHTRVELVAESATPAPGARLTVGIVMKPKPGWHTYWSNPGDSGMPTMASWTLPEGVTAGPLRYPVPDTFVVAGIMNHVFSGENVLLADIEVPASHGGALPIRLQLDWLVCDDKLCVPESAALSLDLSPGDGRTDPAQKARFEAARAALPRTLSEPATFALEGGKIRLKVPLAGTDSVTRAHFFPDGDDSFVFASPQQVTRTADALMLEADAVPGATLDSLTGLVRIERGDPGAGGDILGLTLAATPGPVPPGEPLKPVSTLPAAMSGFLPAFGLALLGGLVLNLMPCVFPILSLKAMSLARAGGSEATARQEGLAYTAGVVLVTTLLGLVAILLARAGAGAGWAFQLQDPRVILFLMLLTFAIALNFAGLFEADLGTANAGAGLATQPGRRGAFFTGALAAFVATPCTGPFMAGALGAALVLPPAAGLAVFAGLGLGLALPFLAIGFIPALRRRLPRPGPWMATFRRILAIPMFLTALALAWVLGRQAGLDALMAGLAAALALAVALWVLGLRQQQQRPTSLAAALALVLALAAPFTLGQLASESPAKAAAAGPDALAGAPFSPEALAAARAARTPTFLYFTADWCLTCKVNEKGALSDPTVAETFRKAGIKVMVGDWTRPDPAIARFLEQQGRAGIPLYLFYGADGTVTELPQILTPDILKDLASPRSAAAA